MTRYLNIIMRKFRFRKSITAAISAVMAIHGTLSAETMLEATSDVNWITRTFRTEISLDTGKTGLSMPSGKKSASAAIRTRMSKLIQPALLSLFSDSTKYLADEVTGGALSVDQVTDFIMEGHKTPDVFTRDMRSLNTTNTLGIDRIARQLIKHTQAYRQEIPLDSVPSRAYSGIIIDARGTRPVHGEYVDSETFPAFFPRIWDDQMNSVYERNMVLPDKALENGIVAYDFAEDSPRLDGRIGTDPLYIRAVQVYGRNRTDPVIKRDDALKILSVPQNLKLLEEGKVVILLDRKNLITKISVPQKDDSYYVNYGTIRQYFYENRIPDVTVTESLNGILFSVDLKFYPDSPELLPSEKERIQAIAEKLAQLASDGSYTVLIEGHTADVGKPAGQLNLSIERTRTVMRALVDCGLDESIFTYKGYGGTMPVATNATEEGRAQNRRVDITARPKATYIQRDW